MLTPAAALTATTGILDYRLWLPMAGITLAGLLLALIALCVRARHHRRTQPALLTHEGIRYGPHTNDLIAWPLVAGVTSMRRPLAGRRIQARLHDGRTIALTRPRGTSWLPDPVFDDDVTTARYFAARHHVRSAPERPGRLPMMLAAAPAMAAVVVLAVELHDRPVTVPWQPAATVVLTACQALDATELLQQSAETRSRDRDLTLHHTNVTSSYCTEWAKHAALTTAPYLRVDVHIDSYAGTWRQSPIGAAMDAYTTTRLGMDLAGAPSAPRSLPLPNADEAFTAPWLDGIQVIARKANVRVDVYVSGRGTDQVNDHTARTLAAGICDEIPLS